MKVFLKKYRLWIIGGIAGAIAGYSYYYFVGCASGTCMITSRPLNSSLYGALMGGLLLSMFRKTPAKEDKTNQQEQ